MYQLMAHIHGAPRCSQGAVCPGGLMRSRTHSNERDIGDMIVIVAITETRTGTGFMLTVFDKHGMQGPREVSHDWFTWDDTFELVL